MTIDFLLSQTAAMNPKPVTTIVCSYRLSPTDIARLLASYGRRLGIRFQGVIIANAPHDLSGISGEWVAKKGSNAEHEFSAYMEGIESLTLAPQPVSGSVLFINDTTFQSHNGFEIVRNLMPYLDPVTDCAVPAIAGKADFYDNICYRSPWSGLPIYVSSFCFLLNRAALPAIPRILADANAELGDRTIDLNDPSWGHGLNTAFRIYVRCHLTYPGIWNSWYKLIESRKNRSLIIQKARSVYFEHRLSGEVGKEGVVFNIYPSPMKRLCFFVREQQAKIKRGLSFFATRPWPPG